VVRVVTQTLKILSILVVSGAVLVGGLGFFNFWSDRSRPDDEGRPTTLTITADDDGGTVAKKLTDADLVNYGAYFETRLRFSGNELAPGTYTLRKGMSASEIIDAVTVPASGEESAADAPAAEASTEIKVTFVEGQRLEEYAETLAAAGWTGDPQAFIAAAKAPANPDAWEFLSSLPDGASLEGYLFPDTYTIPSNALPQDVIDYMLTTFDGRFTDEMRQQAGAEGLTIHEVVTLASLVEREAAVPEENATIAALYRNRLTTETQLLQADPTVQYVVGTEGDWWPALNGDLLSQAAGHPYNTYNVQGLPPGPIANPGLRSLQAVLDPEDVDYLYMVTKDDGTDTHAFTNNLEDHEENICTYDPDADICTGATTDAPERAFVDRDAQARDRRPIGAA